MSSAGAEGTVMKFLEYAATLDGVSVSIEDDQFIALLEEQSEGMIDTSKVHDAAEGAGLRVRNTIADFDSGVVRVYVRRGEGEQ